MMTGGVFCGATSLPLAGVTSQAVETSTGSAGLVAGCTGGPDVGTAGGPTDPEGCTAASASSMS